MEISRPSRGKSRLKNSSPMRGRFIGWRASSWQEKGLFHVPCACSVWLSAISTCPPAANSRSGESNPYEHFAMNRTLKWGIIGSGGIARRRTIPEGFVPARNAHLVSVYGTNAITNKEVAKQFNALAVDSLDALLASDIEAVYIASPVQAHLAQVLASAKAGKHVFCEKPLGRSVAEAEQMVSGCRESGVQLGTAFMMRFQSQNQAAAKLIQEGKLGKPVYARA